MKTWKEQEVQSQMVVNKLKQDKEIAFSNETNCINVRNFCSIKFVKITKRNDLLFNFRE